MVPHLRKTFNAQFSDNTYQAFLKELNNVFPGAIDFRVAETPVFVDKVFTQKMLDACERIIDVIVDPGFRQITEKSIPVAEKVPGEENYCPMLIFDFGVCINQQQQLEPQLIEMQGFPSLFAFQVLLPELYRKHFDIPENYSHYLHGYNRESYLKMLKKLLLDDYPAENVILLEIKPHQQKTRVDFYCTRLYTGIQPVCITELFAEGKDLFYRNNGVKTQVKRIYNRLIFDDLKTRDDLGKIIDITEDWNVEWMPHPNWFYRISKYTLPFIQHPYVPATYFLQQLTTIPADLENYVLKPLFSFAGQGVLIDVSRDDIQAIKDPENWILQQKVQYADAVATPDIPAKVEIRLMFVWEKGALRPHPAINLCRLSKGKMIGVRYNQDKKWVGGSVCFFETY